MARNADSAALHGDLSSFPEFAGRHFPAECQAMASALEEMLMAKVFLQMALNKGVTLQETQKKRWYGLCDRYRLPSSLRSDPEGECAVYGGQESGHRDDGDP